MRSPFASLFFVALCVIFLLHAQVVVGGTQAAGADDIQNAKANVSIE